MQRDVDPAATVPAAIGPAPLNGDALRSRRVFLSLSLASGAALAGAAYSPASRRAAAVSRSEDVLPPAVRARLTEAMREAIAEARLSVAQFGAVLLDAETGRTVYCAHNTTDTGDPTAHAEVNALRGGGLAGIDLSRTVLITTAESCPMCASAAVFAGIAGVVFGTSIDTLVRYGWDQILIPQAEVAARSTFSHMPIVGGFLTGETDPLYAAGPPAKK